MKIAVVKIDGNRLIPAYDSDYDKMKLIKQGEIYEVEIRKPRNVQFHKKFMAMCKMVFDNQEHFTNFNHLRKFLTMKAGYYEEIKTPTGTIYEPKSLSFASMDEYEFENLYKSVLAVIEKEYLISSEAIAMNIGDFM